VNARIRAKAYGLSPNGFLHLTNVHKILDRFTGIMIGDKTRKRPLVLTKAS
jgi:hypothetical protein